MKNSFDINASIAKSTISLLNHDRIEVDNPNHHAPEKLAYLDRINTIINWIRKAFPDPTAVKIAEFGCAQGNISLILAELGYKVYAIDINEQFLSYSMMKYEKGDIEWIKSNINELNLPEGILDIAILGEVIEHCAYPEDIINKVLKYIHLDGCLIITTPNGAQINNRLPTFKQIKRKDQRTIFLKKQFKPDGENHLFVFKLEELIAILPDEAKVLESGYLGGTFIINKIIFLSDSCLCNQSKN